MGDKQPSPNKARKSFPRSRQQSRRTESDSSPSRTARRERDAQTSSTRPSPNKARKSFPRSRQQSRRNESDNSLSSSEQEEKPVRRTSPRLKRNVSKSESARSKGTKQSAGSSTEQPVRKGAAVSIKRGKGSRRNGSRSSSLRSGQRGIDAGSSSKQTRRSRSSPPSTQRVEKESGSSTQQTGNKTKSSVQRSNRNISLSSTASTKRRKVGAGSSSSSSKLPQRSSASTERQRQVAGSSSAAPAGNKARKSFRKPAQLPRQSASQKSSPTNQSHDGGPSSLPRTSDIFVCGRYVPRVRYSTSELSDVSMSPVRPQRDEGGDQSKATQSSSANTGQLSPVAGCSYQNPEPSTSSSARTRPLSPVASCSYQNPEPSTSSSARTRPLSLVESCSYQNPEPSTSSSARTRQQVRQIPPSRDLWSEASGSSDEGSEHRGRREDPIDPPRNIALPPGERLDIVSLLRHEIREVIFSSFNVPQLRDARLVSQQWAGIVESLVTPWLNLCRVNGFLIPQRATSTSRSCRDFYNTLRRRFLPPTSPQGLETTGVGRRYFTEDSYHEAYYGIKAFHYFNKKFIIVSWVYWLRVFDMARENPVRIARIETQENQFHLSNIKSVKLTEIDGRTHVVCLCNDHCLRIWDVEDPDYMEEEKPAKEKPAEEKPAKKKPAKEKSAEKPEKKEPKIIHPYNKGKLVKTLNLNKIKSHGLPQCFDLLQGSRLLVATGRVGFVDIFNVYGTQEVQTGRVVKKVIAPVIYEKRREILKVLLAKDYSPEHSGSNEAETKVERRKSARKEPAGEPTKLFLFSLDQQTVFVQKVKIYFDGNDIVTDEVTNIKFISLTPPPENFQYTEMFACRPTLCFDGTNYLYFTRESPMIRGFVIGKFNIQTGKALLRDNIETDGPVDQLLGSGNNFFAFMTRNRDSTEVKLIIRNLNTGLNIVEYKLPSEGFVGALDYEISSKHESSVVGDVIWLDGLDGTNDTGVICFYQSGRHLMKYVRWTPRTGLVSHVL